MKQFGPLVDAHWLRTHVSDTDLRVIDFRWYLSGRIAADEYAKGHIPGAVFVDMDRELTARKGPGRHPLPGGGQIERAMRAAGVNRATRVVVYDDTGGSIAARLWWLLRYVAHPNVAVLDGGLQAWTAEGGKLSTDVPVVEEGDFNAGPPRDGAVVDKEYVAAARDDAHAVLLDARSAERYRGDAEPIDARPGHIPGARNAPWSSNLVDGRFAPAEELRARYQSLGVLDASDVIVYCGSGVTACHDLLALERAGISGAKLYEGSWSDWARDASLPAACGEDRN